MVACGDDAAPATFMCQGAYASIDNETYAESAMAEGACVNDADLIATCEADLSTIVSICAGITCSGMAPADLLACVGQCVKDDPSTIDDPSDACLGCYQATVSCAFTECNAECVQGSPIGQPCVACRNTKCVPAFFQCSGNPLPPTGDGG